jgi:hypothetical protein
MLSQTTRIVNYWHAGLVEAMTRVEWAPTTSQVSTQFGFAEPSAARYEDAEGGTCGDHGIRIDASGTLVLAAEGLFSGQADGHWVARDTGVSLGFVGVAEDTESALEDLAADRGITADALESFDFVLDGDAAGGSLSVNVTYRADGDIAVDSLLQGEWVATSGGGGA